MIAKDLTSPRIAVIGCGQWGKNLVRNFSELGALEAICDHHVDTTRDLAKQYGATVSTFPEILSNSSLDAVVIATSAASHEDLAGQALAAGKHIYIEKPMTLTTQAARRLCDLAQKHDRLIMVGHILNYHPAFSELKTRLSQLGPLKHIYANRLSLGRFRTQESVLWDLASHDVSLILALAQAIPTTIHAVGSAYLAPQQPASALLTLTFPTGLTAHIHASWASPFKEQKLVVIGEKGVAVFDDCKPWSEKLHLATGCFQEDQGFIQASSTYHQGYIPLPEGEPLRNECQHFLTCIQTRVMPLTSGEEGLRVTEVLEKADFFL